MLSFEISSVSKTLYFPFHKQYNNWIDNKLLYFRSINRQLIEKDLFILLRLQ